MSSLEHLCSTAGSLSSLSYMANLIHCTGQHLKIDLFPENSYCSKEEKYGAISEYQEDCGSQTDEISPCICCGTLHLEKELEKFMKMQDTGLDTNYKCPKCRGCKSCLKGSGQELLNMKEEYQQQIIEDSVRIDDDLGQAVGRLAFVSDPGVDPYSRKC